ncbi:hypothetical protein E3J51_05185 [Candidatus Bathyarchaeota archaeon]|nr:MAG: hypothetical protein E3J51_05185 [Candidatus Bathyarchaeota archaeon]
MGAARAEQEHSGTLPQILKLHPNTMVVATLKCKNLRARPGLEKFMEFGRAIAERLISKVYDIFVKGDDCSGFKR